MRSIASPLRTDIQGLRALAVTAVLVYHLSSSWLPGGFVGVDLFFVVSGFLITSHLLRRPPRTPREFLDFWARRARRLLPASLLVIVVTLVATWFLAPDTLWSNTARQAGAATLYFVNWLLAGDAVDYLAATNAATPVQHYWSLSVEEQFYLLWPVLVGLLVWLATRTGRSRGVVLAVGMGIVVVASLAWSVHLTQNAPGAAYFVTTTRLWELAAGGLVAVVVGDRAVGSRRTRAGVAWVGLGLITWAMVTFDAQTPFPSWRAAVPVLGAALVVGAAAGTERYSPGRWLRPAPVQWVGDISYAVYLWHWPLVVLVQARRGSIGVPEAAAVVVVTLLLAWATTRWVEAPFRSPAWSGRLRASYTLAVSAMAVSLVASLGLHHVAASRSATAEQQLAAALASNDRCLGAGSLIRDCEPDRGPVVPSPVLALGDKSRAYADVSGGKNCWSSEPRYRLVRCTFGGNRTAAPVVLFGNSHAGQWLPAVQRVATAHRRPVRTYLASRCAASEVRQDFATEESSQACLVWTRKAAEAIIASDPALVVLSNRMSLQVDGVDRLASADAYAEGYRAVLQRFNRAGVPVVVLADTPAAVDAGVFEAIPDCLRREGETSTACDGTPDTWIQPREDPAARAVRDLGSDGVRFADLNRYVCSGTTCPAVVGRVVVYFDNSHLTATYARTLSPALAAVLDPVLAQPQNVGTSSNPFWTSPFAGGTTAFPAPLADLTTEQRFPHATWVSEETWSVSSCRGRSTTAVTPKVTGIAATPIRSVAYRSSIPSTDTRITDPTDVNSRLTSEDAGNAKNLCHEGRTRNVKRQFMKNEKTTDTTHPIRCAVR